MTREELWEEFENQLIRETRTPITMNFDTAERMTKLGIKETVAKWKDRLEQETCEDAISRKAAINKLKEHYFDKKLQSAKNDPCIIDAMTDLDIRIIKALPPVTPTKCIATVKFSKEDIQELVNEKMKDIVVERKKGKWLNKDTSGYHFYGKCSNCGQEVCVDVYYAKNMKFCPKCGTEMESEE